MDLTFRLLAIWVIFFVFYKDTGVTGFTLTTNNSPATATYGNNVFELTFTYTLGSGELSPAFKWFRKRSGDSNFVQIASLFSPNTFNASFQDTALENRATLTNPTLENGYTGTVRFTEILCNDEATYKIESTYTTTEGSQTTEREVVVEIRTIATFQDGVALAFSPNANLQEGQSVTFTCDDDVGKNPEGTFNWFRYSSGQTTGGHNITNVAITGDPVSSPSTCSYRRTATFTHILTKDDNGFVVRCALQQITIGTETGNGVRQTDPIPVYYKPTVQSISKTPSRQQYVVGESVMLTCSGQGNPSPSVWWVSMNGTVVQSSQLQLSNLQLSDNHTYTCIVQNNYNGVNYTDSLNITLDVVETTTTSTTTPSSTTPTASSPGGGNTGESKDDDTANAGIDPVPIAVGVSVAVVVIIVIVVVVICLKKKRKPEIEEPPEKPRANNQGYYGNRPDLVTNEDKMKNSRTGLNASFNNSFDSADSKQRNEDGLMYVDLTFDDKPRSRKPIQIMDNGSTPYADIAMPRV